MSVVSATTELTHPVTLTDLGHLSGSLTLARTDGEITGKNHKPVGRNVTIAPLLPLLLLQILLERTTTR